MQKPRYSSADEEKLMATLWSPQIADDPEAFVMLAFPWGEKGGPLEHLKGPRVWQREFLRTVAKSVKENKGVLDKQLLQEATASGRGIGKSCLVAWLILWMLSTKIGASVIVSANKEEQLRTSTWGELSKWAAMVINSHWWEMGSLTLKPAQWLTELAERDLKKGTRLWAAEGKLWSEENPDGYAGPHNMDGMLCIFDEASGIPDSIWSVAKGFFTENVPNRFWFAFSNPRRNQGYFFECFNAKRDFWGSRQIDAREVEDSDKKLYDEIIAEYGEDSNEAKIEVYGEFPSQGDEQFISPRIVDEAMERPKWNDPSAPVIMGVDPARGGTDSTVIVVRKGRDLTNILRYKGEDTMEIVGRVIEAISQFRPDLTVIDEGGLGYGILDRLNEQNYSVRGVNFGWKSKTPRMYGNKRAEMWGESKKWVKTASLPLDRQLKADATGPKTKTDSSGVIFLEGKKEMKARGLASPDAWDALVCTFAYPVMAKETSHSDNSRHIAYDMGAGSASWMAS